ncbi:site-specific integrase [Parvibaculum sp.]|uniref:tyrosine-type recombinase/integrase n=1 Tax=Parvibaculum sp. TaxID=2024848 RepID=UPI00273494E3|nr:site-specific integrase [Parvibaculum sp.]MDP3328767.1 site-specific integrase [Parvibaculum sp.]
MITESQIKAAVRSAPHTGKTIELKDDGDRGSGRLSLQVRALKNKVVAEWYAVYYRIGKRRMTKIGSYPTMGLAEARKAFREDFAPAISIGASPDGRLSRASHKHAYGTVEDLFTAYVASLRSEGKRSAGIADRILLTSPKATPVADTIGRQRPASEIGPQDIVGHLAEVHGRGSVVMASIIRSWVSAAFAWGMKSEHSYTGEHVGTRWGIKANPVLPIASDPAAKRTSNRFLSPRQFRDFWEWLNHTRANSRANEPLMLQLALGQRGEEILRISADVFDRRQRMLFWTETKNGAPHAVPLTDLAFNLLDSMTPNKKGLYFPAVERLSEAAPATLLHQRTKAYVEATGAEKFTPRDIRRTWKTLAGQAGIPKDMRDRLQNHAAKGDISSRHYDRYDYLPEKRAAMDVWAAYMDKIIAGEIDTDVVKLPAAAG